MNIGEGLRIAALAKQGSAGVYLLGNPDPVKKKKFSYKKKAQKYPLRRPGTQLQKAATQDENNENESQVKKKPSVDFIKRNTVAVKNTGGPGKQKSRTKLDNGKKKGDSDMVTMTQKQLNALLAAIGTNIAVESGEVKLTAEKEKSIVSEKSSEALKQKEEVSLEENLLNREEVKVKSPMREQAETEDVPRSQNEKATRQIAGENDYATGMGNIGSIIGTTGYNDRSLAEMKRLQWKQELDDQVALKKKHEGEKRNLRKSQDAELQRSMNEWFPFGRSGGGAPNEVHSVVAPENQHNQSRQTRAPAAYQSLSPPRAQYTQEPAVPAAMRSSFVLGEISPREHQHSAVKREEKQQWLQELEKQRQEMRERKEREKREAMQTYQDTWADQFDTFRGQPQNPRYQTVGTRPKQIVDDAAVTTTTFKSSEPSLHGDAESKSKSAPQTADPMSMRSDFSPANPNNAKSEAIHARGRGTNSLMDPAEKDRLDKARQKQLEHQMAIKAQVEEKLRLKREAEEKKRLEELEGERKLAQERKELQRQYDMERQKQRQKEEDLERKTKMLMQSMQLAQEQAAQEKHERRIKHLKDGGHDVKHLQKSYDAKPPEASPRGRFSPEKGFTSNISRAGVLVDPSFAVSTMQEDSALKSPVREQGIQTEMPDLPTNFVREDSAGIEFKVNNQKKEQKDNRTVKEDYRERSRSRVKDKFERRVRSPSPVYEEIPQRKKHMKISERPQWGSTAPGKKSRKASDRDLTIDRRKKEERLRKRQEQLLIMQEMNTRHRLMRERTPSPPIPAVQSRMRSYSPGNRSPAKPIRYESPTGRRTRHRSYSPTGQHTKQSHVSTPPNPDHPASPPVKTGDFAPFMRSEAHQLIPDSLPPTPNEPKHRQRYSQDNHEERYPKKRDKRTEQEKDPLLNPERLKDSELRQEMILKQLSHLRQGLILKQREMEVGMTPLIH